MFNESNGLLPPLKWKLNVNKMNILFLPRNFDIITLSLDNQKKLGKK